MEIEPETWDRILAQLPRPLPAEVAVVDLRYHATRPGRPVGRPALAARWGWTEHAVRQLVASSSPARRQLVASGGTVEPGDPSDFRQFAASSPPVRRQFDASSSDPGASECPVRQLAASGGTVEPGDPANSRQFAASSSDPGAAEGSPPVRRQLAASGGTVEPGDPANSRQFAASSPPVRSDESPPIPPPDLSLLFSGSDPVQIDTPRPTALGPEVTAFLRVWGRWRSGPVPWTGGPTEAAAWFVELLASPPGPVADAVAAVDVVAALGAWDAWLADRAAEIGQPGSAKRSKFPRSWRNALRNWIVNQHRYGRSLRAAPRTGSRRGAWAGVATNYDDSTTTNTVPGDADALDRF